ncbi:MAG: hypothetical protein QNJ45_21100 [Ardenticatenaceae bacterium]|nr:hypothetical protein [Ardenticatenaceae bacterium]
MFSPQDFFDLSDPFIAEFFDGCEFVWDVLPRLQAHISRLVGEGQTIRGAVAPGAYMSDRPIFVEEGAVIEPGAYVEGPAFIARGAVVRHGAFIRENVIMLPNSILGHASEAKNSLFLPNAHAPHFAYVGDSVLGHNTNLGAGTKLSNLTLVSEKDKASGKRPTIKLHVNDEVYDTGLAKFGAILGDGAQTGCNAVLNPGCVLGKRALVYANLSLRKGYYPPDTILKLRQKTQTLPRR